MELCLERLEKCPYAFGSRRSFIILHKFVLSIYQAWSERTRIVSYPEGETSATVFLHSSYLKWTDTVMLWSVLRQNDAQVSHHWRSAKLQTCSDVSSVCPSTWMFLWLRHWQNSKSTVEYQGEDCSRHSRLPLLDSTSSFCL